MKLTIHVATGVGSLLEVIVVSVLQAMKYVARPTQMFTQDRPVAIQLRVNEGCKS
jgi:hypothetical protein